MAEPDPARYQHLGCRRTLLVVDLLVGMLVLIRVTLGDAAYAYWMFWGKVGADAGYH